MLVLRGRDLAVRGALATTIGALLAGAFVSTPESADTGHLAPGSGPIVVLTDLEPDDRRALRVVARDAGPRVAWVGTTLFHAGRKAALARRWLDQVGLPRVPVHAGSGAEAEAYPATPGTLAGRTFRHEGVGLLSAAELDRLARTPRGSDAVQRALVETLRSARDVEILLLSPATDLVAVLRARPELAASIRRIVISGGWLNTPKGRRTSYNWTMDAEAAAWLAANDSLPIVLFSSDRVREVFGGASVNRDNYPAVILAATRRAYDSTSAFEDTLASATWDRHVVSTYPPLREVLEPHVGRNFSPSDPATALALVDGAFVSKTRRVRVRVRAEDFDPSTGYAVDVEDAADGNVVLVEGAHLARFEAKLVEAIERTP